MAFGFYRVGKIAMAAVGTVWTVSNVESLYSQTKLLFLPSSYPFLFFHVILLTILFQCSSLASKFNHLLLKLLQSSAATRTPTNPPPQEDPLPRSFSGIWHRVLGFEPHPVVTEFEPSIKEEDEFGYSVEKDQREGDDLQIVPSMELEEDVEEEEEGGISMEETWKAIMEGKQQAEERELKKSNTWAVTPTIEQLKRKPVKPVPGELESSKSFARGEENGGRRGWRRTEVVLTREELNQRADEFITRIKNNIRLERLESYNLFLKLINRRGD